MKHLYYIRHGESEANAAGVWSGTTNHPLSKRGHEQAQQAAAQAKAKQLSFDIIISSPLDRAHQTAQYVAEAVEFPKEKIIVHDGFIERHFGSQEDQSSEETYPQHALDETYMEQFGAEPFADVQKRAEEMVAYLHTLPHDTVLVVGHGSFGRALRKVIDKTPFDEYGQKIPNAEIIKFI